MLNKLHFRILLGLGITLLLFGLVFQMISRNTTAACVREVHQKMYRDLAENLVEEWVASEGPNLTKGRISSLFKSVLDANPQYEIFLLDAEGAIVCSSATDNPVKTGEVNLQPIKRFLSTDREFPIYGEDPLHPENSCLFSVAPIRAEDESINGYLYVMLEEQTGLSLDALIAESNVMTFSSLSTMGGLFIVMVIGTVLVVQSTSRLRRLARQLTDFRNSAFRNPEVIPDASEGGDEVHHLQRVSHQMAQRMARQLESLELEGEFRKELITNVSHDLRTPLASLNGYLEILDQKSETLSAVQLKRQLSIVRRNARRLTDIVSEMEQLVRLDNGEIGLMYEPVHLGEVLTDLLQQHQDKNRESGLSFELLGMAESNTVSADPAMLEHALLKIVDHIEHHARPQAKVRVRLRSSASEVSVDFTDAQRYVDELTLALYFDRYHQEVGNPHVDSGGIGIAISRRIISLHGGTVEATSSADDGTTITLNLPVNRDQHD